MIKWKKFRAFLVSKKLKGKKHEIKQGERITPHFIDCSSKPLKHLNFMMSSVDKLIAVGQSRWSTITVDCAVFASTDFKWGKYGVALFVIF